MKATTLRPLLIVLLFGFLPTSGWMIVRGGADHTVTRVITNSCPMPGAAAHRHASGPWPATGGKGRPGAIYAQPSASIGPAARSNVKTPELVANAHPGDGFGNFSVPGTLSGPASGDPAATGVPVNAFTGDPGDPALDLLDPPGGMGMTRTDTTGTGTGGATGTGTGGATGIGTPGSGSSGPATPGTSIGGSSNHQVIAPEPSTLALFLAGAALLGLAALRRRRLAG